MSEQDTYNSHLGGNRIPIEKATSKFSGLRAEQDTYASHFEGHPIPTERASSWRLSNLGKAPTSNINTSSGSGAEQDRYGSHFIPPWNPKVNATAIGLLQRSLLPAVASNTSISLVTYAVARLTNRPDVKEYVWALGPLITSWGAALQRHNFDVVQTWTSLAYPQKLILAGLTAWSARLLYRITSRSYARSKYDPQVVPAEDPGFWNRSLWSIFLPEALVQSAISLPFTMSLAAPEMIIASSPLPSNPGWQVAGAAGVFFFSAGYALEAGADYQLKTSKKDKKVRVSREGMWSIVRHPNYLGETLIHASFPLILYGAGLFHPLMLLAPAANYAFLKYAGVKADKHAKLDTKKSEDLQAHRKEKNAFWPSADELQNQWVWIVGGIGVGAVLIERGLKEVL